MRILSFLLLFVSVSLLFSSCKPEDEKLNMSPSVRLRFDVVRYSTEKDRGDTVMFDTVFVQKGSVTKRLWVYNDERNAVNIERIELARASGDQFSLIINGKETSSATNVRLRGNDSLQILVKVNVDPKNQNEPFLLQDSIHFITNGSFQDVDLVAYGQDAYYHNFSYTTLEYLNECPTSIIWNADKPHVVYGVVGIPAECELTINAGTQVYFHARSGIQVEGTLNIFGEKDKRVTLQGDRREDRYKNRPGQWNGIVLNGVKTESYIAYADIKNAVYGLFVQAPDATLPGVYDLNMEQTTVRNMIANALFAFASNVRAVNCVFANTGEAAVATFSGGAYEFIHCTIVNFGGFFLHDQPTARFEVSSKLTNGSIAESQLNLTIKNSIIYGSIPDEVVIVESSTPGLFTPVFQNNIVRTKEHAALFPVAAENVVSQVTNYPEFNATSKYDLVPDSSKTLTAIGIPGLTNVDVRGLQRPIPAGSRPDVGAYEVQQP